MMDAPCYQPLAGLRTKLDEFRDYVNLKYQSNIVNYFDLHAFSVNRMNDFWMTFWDFSGVIASQRPLKAVDETIEIDKFPKFFEDAQLNFAENLLNRPRCGLAVINADEETLLAPDRYSWSDLRELVRHYASALQASEFKKGAIVAVIGGNCVRSLALMLAVAASGGIFSSFSTDTGDKALISRLEQLKPCFLFVESLYSYNGKKHDISAKIDAVAKHLAAFGPLQLIVNGPISGIQSKCVQMDTFLERGTMSELKFAQVPFNTPFVVMFSSGTTGAPKGIVHSHGSLVVNALKESLLHDNLTSNDLFYQYTSIGWALWNMSVGSLFAGAPVVLYDGSPFYPNPGSFIKAMFSHKITCFGAGPRYYSELQKLGVQPKQYAHRLHTIISTGAVLTPSLAKWMAEAFGPVCQISKSGGTELAGAFLHGTRSLPSYPGQIAVKVLGMDIAVYGADGESLPDGESGELVCRKPFPNMPTHFLNDPDKQRYSAAYFEKFPHVWTHGDFVQTNKETKGFYVLGRSDGVLNPSGVRFGSSEIYNILAKPRFSAAITDSIVVGQQRIKSPYSDPAELVVLFVKCTPSASSGSLLPRPELRAAIDEQISKDLSRRHVPEYVFEIDNIPYNANGKKLEIPVKAVLCEGRAALNRLKITKEEMMQVAAFLPFHAIETVGNAAKKVYPRL